MFFFFFFRVSLNFVIFRFFSFFFFFSRKNKYDLRFPSIEGDLCISVVILVQVPVTNLHRKCIAMNTNNFKKTLNT